MKKDLPYRLFRQIRQNLPKPAGDAFRNVATALLTPISFSLRSGHFLSSLKTVAVSSSGQPIPWYTYPCIDFLRTRDFRGRTVLEFGGGQSTLWWAEHAERVITFEDNSVWYERIKHTKPENVDVYLVSGISPEICIREIREILRERHPSPVDLVVIDGLCRRRLLRVSLEILAKDGGIICDNSDRYGFYPRSQDRLLQRVDFFGHAPGVFSPHCTSLYFDSTCFLFSTDIPIPGCAETAMNRDVHPPYRRP